MEGANAYCYKMTSRRQRACSSATVLVYFSISLVIYTFQFLLVVFLNAARES